MPEPLQTLENLSGHDAVLVQSLAGDDMAEDSSRSDAADHEEGETERHLEGAKYEWGLFYNKSAPPVNKCNISYHLQ